MKILHITPYFEPAFSYGGVVTVVSSVSRKQVELGHEVAIVSTDVLDRKSRYKGYSFPHYLDQREVYYFKNISNYLASRYNLYTGNLKFIVWLWRNIQRFDAVHLHSVFNPFNIASLIIARLRNIKVVLTPHGSLLFDRIVYKKRIKSFFISYIKSFSPNFKAIHALTEVEKTNLVSLGFDSQLIKVVPNGIEIKDFNHINLSSEDRNDIISKYDLDPNSPTVLFLARVHRIKGAHLLVQSTGYLLDKYPNINIVIAGPDDGYLNECLRIAKESRVTDNVKFIGPVSGDRKVKLLKFADVFCLPSESEGFSMVVLEAAISGCALVLSQGCNFPEVTDYNSGIITSLDPHNIAENILNAVSDKDTLGKNAIEMVSKGYTWDFVVNELMSLYAVK